MDDDNPATKASARTFTLWQLICFGVLTTPLAMANFAFVLFVPTFYAVDMGLGLGLVGAVFVAGRLFDVVTDPLIGYMSDETRTRWGPRKPWIMLGVPAFGLSSWLLLTPTDGAGLVYLLIVSGFYFLTYTALDVPYSTIGLEISPHVHERSSLASSKAVFQVIGALIVSAIPVALVLQIPQALTLTAKVIGVLLVLGLLSFLLYVPSKHRVVTAPRIGITDALKLVMASAPYKTLIVSFLIVQSANALTAGLSVLFITHVIGAPELIGVFMGLLLLSSALFLPVWIMISKSIGKPRAWQAAILVCCIVLGLTPLLGPGDTAAMVGLSVIIGATFGADAIMPTSMLADIVYEGERAGESRLAGLYLAVKNAVSKLAFVVPMGLAFPILDWVDFDEASGNGSLQLFVLTFFYALLPIGLRLIALSFVRRNYVDAYIQKVVKQ